MNQDLAVFLVPGALGLSCALLTFGALYFMDMSFWFVKSAATAIAALVGGFLILGVMEVILYGSSTGYFKAQQLQTSACELEGESAHPEARLGADPKTLHATIVACMNTAGYEWRGDHRHCKDAPLATNPFCYLPTAWFDRSITDLQMQFE